MVTSDVLYPGKAELPTDSFVAKPINRRQVLGPDQADVEPIARFIAADDRPARSPA